MQKIEPRVVSLAKLVTERSDKSGIADGKRLTGLIHVSMYMHHVFESNIILRLKASDLVH